MRSAAYERVLVVLDGSVNGERGVTWVRELTGGPGSIVQLVVVRPPAVRLRSAGGTVAFVDQLEDAERATALEYLDRVARPLREDGLTVATEVRVGRLIDTVRAAAQDLAADLVVLTFPAARGFQRRSRTGLPSRIVRTIPVPVLIAGPGCRRSA
jgi:nucleotide-binding universal stress UspA family protein